MAQGDRPEPRTPQVVQPRSVTVGGVPQAIPAEIEVNVEALNHLKQRLKLGRVTFVYAAKDEAHNSALVLKEFLERAT